MLDCPLWRIASDCVVRSRMGCRERSLTRGTPSEGSMRRNSTFVCGLGGRWPQLKLRDPGAPESNPFDKGKTADRSAPRHRTRCGVEAKGRQLPAEGEPLQEAEMSTGGGSRFCAKDLRAVCAGAVYHRVPDIASGLLGQTTTHAIATLQQVERNAIITQWTPRMPNERGQP